MNQIAWLFSSRKGLLTVLAIVMATILVSGITAAAITGRITWEKAFELSSVDLFAALGVIFKTIDGVATEDAASKGRARIGDSNVTADLIATNTPPGAQVPISTRDLSTPAVPERPPPRQIQGA